MAASISLTPSQEKNLTHLEMIRQGYRAVEKEKIVSRGCASLKVTYLQTTLSERCGSGGGLLECAERSCRFFLGCIGCLATLGCLCCYEDFQDQTGKLSLDGRYFKGIVYPDETGQIEMDAAEVRELGFCLHDLDSIKRFFREPKNQKGFTECFGHYFKCYKPKSGGSFFIFIPYKDFSQPISKSIFDNSTGEEGNHTELMTTAILYSNNYRTNGPVILPSIPTEAALLRNQYQSTGEVSV